MCSLGMNFIFGVVGKREKSFRKGFGRGYLRVDCVLSEMGLSVVLKHFLH